MFGYITVNQQELKLKEFDRYRSVYCGLCHALKMNYGRTGQLLLNYDMTFLALLLQALYEPEEKTRRCRCAVHPLKKHPEISGEALDYAADMTVLLAAEKAADDWNDDRSISAWMMTKALKKKVSEVRERYPRQASCLKEMIRLLGEAEKNHESDIDRISGFTGLFLSEIYVWREDEWQEDLRRLGFYLGKFIYLMDAYEDLEEDRRKGRYNLLLEAEAAEKCMPDAQQMMMTMMAGASAAFERLPIVQDAQILRNILYSGVWLRYAAVRDRRSRQEKKKETQQ